jgi:hypothetical protein
MRTLAAHARSTPESSFLLTAAHYLLLGGEEDAVAAFYPSVAGEARGEGDPYPLFRDFCLEHAEEIRTLISTRRVQQNEVRRCAQLLPAFGLVAERVGSPLALVEVGLARASTSSSTATPTTTETGGSAATRALRCASPASFAATGSRHSPMIPRRSPGA